MYEVECQERKIINSIKETTNGKTVEGSRFNIAKMCHYHTQNGYTTHLVPKLYAFN